MCAKIGNSLWCVATYLEITRAEMSVFSIELVTLIFVCAILGGSETHCCIAILGDGGGGLRCSVKPKGLVKPGYPFWKFHTQKISETHFCMCNFWG